MTSPNFSIPSSTNITDGFITCQGDYAKHLEAVNIVRTTTAAISTLMSLISLAIFLYLICRKRNSWDTPSHRLIAAFLATALIYSLATIFQWVRLNYNYSDDHDEPYVILCQTVGFFVEYFSWALMLMTFFLIFHLFKDFYESSLNKICSCFVKIKILKKLLKKLFNEINFFIKMSLDVVYLISYVVISYGFPLLFVWAPFIPSYSGYGVSGYWCWIEVCDDDGRPYISGYIQQAALWYFPILVISILISLLVAAVLFKMWRNKKESKVKRNSWESDDDENNIVSCPLLSFPFVFLIVNTFAFANRVVVLIIGRPYTPLAFLHGFIDPLWGVLASLTLYTYIGIVHCREQVELSRGKKLVNKVELDSCDDTDSLLELSECEEESNVEEDMTVV